MKKLLVLALVLGLASVANAVPIGIELSFGGVTDGPGTVQEVELLICTEVVIDVLGPEGLDWMGYVVIAGPFPDAGVGGEWGDDLGPPYGLGYYYLAEGYPIVLAGAGDMASAKRFEMGGFGFGYELIAAQAEGANPGGHQFDLLYHCCGPDSEYVTINLLDAAGGVQDTIVVHQIPEPMTIALLGLGGLFLLRRRR